MLLLLASYIFYASWGIKYIFVLLAITVFSYFAAIVLDIIENVRVKKVSCVLSVVILLGGMCYKYFNFAISTLNLLMRTFDINIAFSEHTNLLVPIGISFYTLQTIGYIIDVYRNDLEAEKNFIDYALFVSFFPQIVSGPIARAPKLLKQFKLHKRKFDYDNFVTGILKILYGFFLKIVIADRAGFFVDVIYGNYMDYSGVYIVLATLLYTVQIYSDFAGYSSIAIGVSKIIGVDIIENFDAPYFATSVREFWRRWHISLSTWFRDYLYFPLGGSRCSIGRHCFNILIVFLASGLWHGANWTFIIWGLLHGFYQIVEILIEHITKLHRFVIKRRLGHRLLTFLLVAFGWFFFRVETISKAVLIIEHVIVDFNWPTLLDEKLFELGINHRAFLVLIVSIFIVFTLDYIKYKNGNAIAWFKNQNIIIKDLIVIISVVMIVIVGVWGNSYNAENFIYTQF